MPGPRDSSLDLRTSSDGDLTADETLTLTLRGGNSKENLLSLHVLVPDASETSDTLKVTYKVTTSNYKIEVTHTDLITVGTHTFPFHLVLPLPPHTQEDVSVALDVTDDDAGGDVDFGEVLVWLEGWDVQAVPST